MLEWLRKNDVRWIVKPPEYPEPVSDALLRLESRGILQPVASTQVEDFAGWRIEGRKNKRSRKTFWRCGRLSRKSDGEF